MRVIILNGSPKAHGNTATALYEVERTLQQQEHKHVVKDQISAKVEDGILTITMPKTEPKEKVTKAIEVS